MPKRRLTDRTLKALKAASTRKHYDVMDDVVHGFGVRVSDKGLKTFILIARYPGAANPTRRALGQYDKGMTLEAARKKATEWRRLLSDHIDPKVEAARRKQEEARRRTDSFGSVAEAYVAHIKRAKYRRAIDVERCLRREFTSRWAKRAIRDISRRDVIEVIDAIVRRGAPYAAHNALAYVRSMFNWAIDRYGLETSPCYGIKPKRIISTKKISRQRVLTDDELRTFWHATGELAYPFGSLFRMLLLTGQRRSEVAEARWREIDLDRQVWTVPPERFKSETSHLVPLTDDVIDLLKALPRFESDHVFSTTMGVKAVSGFSKAKRALDRLMRRDSPFVLHDLRRTMRTRLSSLQVPDTVSEMVIGHGRKGLQRVYDQHAYLDEMRHALTLWQARLRDIVTPPPPNVVKLKAKT